MTATIPPIADKGRRTLRTVLQVGIPAFLALAVLLPVVITALHLRTDSRLYLVLVATAAVITAAAGVITRVMAIPGFDRILTVLGIGSISPTSVQIVLRDAAEQAQPVLEQLAPIVDAVAPEAAPVVASLDEIATAVAETPVAPATVAAATTAALPLPARVPGL